ncbi:transmembrane protein 248-like [Actinia tenebrosa]|uniref:Transmembrane protein 248-like n=1 Tax=Actinia tenebrosa TaxID=6105 RepID=A0A6P8HXX8_ACTTE|nr:transmembrane protein 248-like [Actinia tenebrosa]
MLECKCIKNLVGFAASRPPFVIFTLCLAIFAAGLFSIGYYVQSYGYEGAEMSQWKTLIKHVSDKEFCMYGNNMSTQVNTTNTTIQSTPSSLNLVQVNLPVVLRFSPNSLFFGSVQNISHVTTVVQGSELGLRGEMASQLVNFTFSLEKPWSQSCGNQKCQGSVFSTCVSALLPEGMIPKDIPHYYCNATRLQNMALMVTSNHCGKYCCIDGITAKALFLRYFQSQPNLEGPSEMGLNDWDTVNLRLQYSSYFLFVMAITCILYGMIRGRSVKSVSKKANGQTI